jgi:hypothetical protein
MGNVTVGSRHRHLRKLLDDILCERKTGASGWVFMARCRSRALVSDHLERALTDDEAEPLAQHLNSCEGCTRYVDQMRSTNEALGRIRGEPVPALTRERLLAKFRHRRSS